MLSPPRVSVVIPTLVRKALLKNALVEVILPNALEVAKKLVELAFVNIPVEAMVVPIGVLLIVPPVIVRPSTTNASLIELVGKLMVEVTVRIPIVVEGLTREPVIVSPFTFTNRESNAEPSA
jgi:hypothetical protein